MNNKILLMIISTALLTFVIRYIPVVFLRERKVNPLWQKFLRNLPIGILSALVFQSVFLQKGQLYTGWSDFYLLGFLISVVLAITTKNLAIVVFGGLGVVAIATLLMGSGWD